MSILNRPPGTGPIYNDQGVLTGGLDALEKLGDVIDNDQNADDKEGGMGVEGELSEARELPVSSASTDCSLDESDEVDSADENILEDDESGPMDITPTSSMIDFSRPDTAASDIPPPPPPSQADVARLRDVMGQETGHDGEQGTSDIASVSRAAVAATTAPPSVMSDAGRPEGEGTPGTTQTADTDDLAPGDKLKQVYIKHGVVESMIVSYPFCSGDLLTVSQILFFEHPSNNFLHHAVFDFIQQIFNGRIGPGFNRELVIVLFNDGRLISRILDAQRVNDSLVWVL
jgi:SIT4-associating protein SAP185/190